MITARPDKKKITFSPRVESTGKITVLQDGQELIMVQSAEAYRNSVEKLKNIYERMYNVVVVDIVEPD